MISCHTFLHYLTRSTENYLHCIFFSFLETREPLIYLFLRLFSAWCRRTDELVDGPNAEHMSSEVLDRWEERLHDIFEGHPYDMLDAALTHTVFNFPLDIKVLN